jgi:hypothetical protein
VWVVITVVAVLVAVLIAMLVLKRRGIEGSTITPVPAPKQRPELAPMTGLESALEQALDSSGRNMRQKLESADAIDGLRVPDDTGPILRRALDHVEHRTHHDHVDRDDRAAAPTAPGTASDTATATAAGPQAELTAGHPDGPTEPTG